MIRPRTPDLVTGRRIAASVALALAGAMTAPSVAAAQWVTTFEQFYFPDRTNWAFRNNYPAADRLFNAFDYGHAILYERLYTRPNDPPEVLEEKEFNFITRKLLVSPPRVPLEEAAIEIAYAKLAPEAKAMFDWAHVLHRQVYDIWADERVPLAEKDARIAKIVSYYKTRPDLAFSAVPKNMELMEGQYYSRAFRDRYPKFNGLIWGYHWLQVGLYEPLVTGRNAEERQTGILATVARFRQMIENAPENMPRLMPMTAAIAPVFSARYPEAAIIFDNLHGMHDVISDILASPKVPREKKRQEILTAASRYRDSTSFVMTRQEWSEMATMMGIANMGGPAVGFSPEFPTPTVRRGATAEEAMKGMHHGDSAGTKGMPGMQHASPASGTPSDTSAVDHSKMDHSQTPGTAAPAPASGVTAPATDSTGTVAPPTTTTPPSSTTTPASEPASRPAPQPARARSQPARVRAQPKKAETPTPPAKKPEPPMDHSNMPGMKSP